MTRPLTKGSWLALLLALCVGGPAPCAETKPEELLYHPVVMQKDGSVNRGSLDRTLDALSRKVGSRPVEVVLLVHGFNTTEEWGRNQYQTITRTLREQVKDCPLAVEVVGVHWPSYPGSGWDWIPKMVGYRLMAELGFRQALRNPYWKKVGLARRTGRSGLRSLIFGLQDRLKNARVHALAHSMGSEVVLRALAPEQNGSDPEKVTQPERTLHLGLVGLAGADLDEDIFSSRGDAKARLALDRADLWWFTVPKKSVADAVLELRRGAGRRDAIGNLGLTLFRSDLDRLLSRRGLVIDDQEVPITHGIEAYFGDTRLEATLGAIAYLRDPKLLVARRSIPAALEPYDGPAPATRYVPLASATLRLYAEWRETPGAKSYGSVRVSERQADQARRRIGSRVPQPA